MAQRLVADLCTLWGSAQHPRLCHDEEVQGAQDNWLKAPNLALQPLQTLTWQRLHHCELGLGSGPNRASMPTGCAANWSSTLNNDVWHTCDNRHERGPQNIQKKRPSARANRAKEVWSWLLPAMVVLRAPLNMALGA